MKNTRRILSFLLLIALVLPMMLLAGSALAEKENYVASSGGPVHVWPEPKKVAGTALGKLKYGTALVVLDSVKGFKYVSGGGLSGWMDSRYVGSREIKPVKDPEIKDLFFDKIVRGTADDSIINIWPTMKNRGKNVMVIPVGAEVGLEIKYDNGWSWVSYEKANGEYVSGYMQSKWLVVKPEK